MIWQVRYLYATISGDIYYKTVEGFYLKGEGHLEKVLTDKIARN